MDPLPENNQTPPLPQSPLPAEASTKMDNPPPALTIPWIPFLISFLVFAIFMIAVGFLLARFLSSSNSSIPSTSSTPSASPTLPLLLSEASAKDGTPDPTTNWKTYKFSSFPLSFQYPGEISLEEKTDQVNNPPRKRIELKYKNSLLVITPDQQGLGFENPDLETSTESILLGKNQFSKTKILNKINNSVSYLITIQYPDKRDYLIMITYAFNNGIYDKNIDQLFDQILSTFRFL
ncbi:hypothetical protein A2773_06890 [Candidatus Gottesmanbacteria bacterium RIFCSPHIGHO2_01_FULL_39_10]|uniref:Uncharacterized protein n=1 Tax=Candidatus Gottesmanbacteria bacterium RIFCSPHIGHO2_01_FULL_39_10 TaxID=1798375 RepID=A0A1F5ZQS9_9BACT|nr:MAG: hypothetical protein A2773_06890 [Candidatus Gottesmanbacteria bacterium RIFCSPHIGHO2_01_FULL_39_10]